MSSAMEFRITSDLNAVRNQIIDANFAECQAWLEENLAPYRGMVVTEEAIGAAKKYRANIRSLAGRIDEYRKMAKAAALALAQAGCRVTVCARTPEKAAVLAARCGGVTVSWEDLPRAAAEHGLLLNATPLGMEGSPEFESLDFVQALPAKAVVYDLVYHPTDTALMRAAEHRGLTAVGGLALLVQQAALSFAHFTGIVPDAALCRDILQELEAAQ